MIKIVLSDKTYEYDVRSLTKAFFPKDDLTLDKINKDLQYVLEVITSKDKIEVYLKDSKESILCEKSIEVNLSSSLNELEYKSEYKNLLKIVMYNLFTTYTKHELPWGTLTGIRPNKIAMDMLEKGNTLDETIQKMQNRYLCNEDKARLSANIAKKELAILNEIDYKNGYSLYVGIPFCPTRCLYCSFTSYSLEKYSDYVEKYLEALFKEIDYAKDMIKNKTLVSVYIGGGTPTTLTSKQLARLIDKLKDSFDFSTVREFCVEAGRPDSITFDKLCVLKEKGVDRISINPQSMVQKTLDYIGRKHTVGNVISSFELARKAGHNNINMDIILGLIGENIDDVRYTLNEIDKLSPESLTVHTLAIKRAAYLNIYKDRYEKLLPKHVGDMVDLTMKYAKSKGYEPYYLYRQKNMTDNLENVGYSKKGYESIYNILIMEEKQTILALGAGAVCKFVDYENTRLDRVDNVKSIKDYVERIDDMIFKKQKFVKEMRGVFNGIF